MALKFLLLISRALPSSRRIMQAWGVSGYIISQFWDLLSHLPKNVKKQQQKWNKRENLKLSLWLFSNSTGREFKWKEVKDIK